MVEEEQLISEVGPLQRIIICAPHDGVARVLPIKSEDWLFEDIIDIHSAREEYEHFVKILLHFVDPAILEDQSELDFSNQAAANYFRSKRVIDIVWLLSDVLEVWDHRVELLSAISANESIPYQVYSDLLFHYKSRELAMALLTGCDRDDNQIIAPIPNVIMVRDIAAFVKDHVIVCRASKNARRRESIIMYSIVNHHKLFESYRQKKSVILLTETENLFLLDEDMQDKCRMKMEGGDILVAAPNHIFIGISERTSIHAAERIIKEFFQRNVVSKVTLIFLPCKRHCMHLDTVVTQVRKDLWLVFPPMLDEVEDKESLFKISLHNPLEAKIHILQYQRKPDGTMGDPVKISSLRKLLTSVSVDDLGCTSANFALCGNGTFPNEWREQWTDGCNSLALRNGVIFLYDRNRQTIQNLKKQFGFDVISADQLLQKLEKKEIKPEEMTNTVITLRSAEISRARGGPHCLSLPVARASVKS